MLLVCALSFAGSAHAQQLVAITSPPNPVGAGARATGVGSAFIAIADDATAASWNPGGLVQLERPELSIVGAGALQVDEVGTLHDRRSDRTDITAEVGTDTSTSVDLNFLSGAVPFAWRGRNVVVSLNYHQVLSFDRDLDFVLTAANDNGSVVRTDFHFEQAGGIYSVSPAIAIELTPEISLGVAGNYWCDGLGRSEAWVNHRRQDVEVTSPSGDTTSTPISGTETLDAVHGVGATFGLLASLGWGVKLGAVVDIPFHVSFRSREVFDVGDQHSDATESADFEIPLAYGFGLSWRADDRLVVSVDVSRVAWDDFRITSEFGSNLLVSGDTVGTAHVDPVTTVRAGAEYTWVQPSFLTVVRGGAFYDPDPSRGAPEDFYGVAAGLGITFDRASIDLAYQLRFGLNVSGTAVARDLFESPSATFDVFQHALYLSSVYYF